jgi:hypothetical protein
MAGPSVAVKILADLTGFSKSVGDTATQGEGAASRLKGAFTGALGALNATGAFEPITGALEGVMGALEQVGEHGMTAGQKMMAVGTGVAGIGAGLAVLGSKDQAVHNQLQQSIEDTGNSYSDFSKQIDDTIKHQENFGHTSAQTQDALSRLTQVTHDPTEALKLMGTVSDVAAAKHEDLGTAAQQVGKAYEGNSKILKDFGITIDKNTGLTKDHKTAMQALADVTKGQASASMDTFAGKLDVIKTKVEDQVAAFGAKYGPALTAAGSLMAALGSVTEIASAAQAVFNAIMDANPLVLIALAIAAVIAVLVVIAVKTGIAKDAFNDLKAVAGDVWQFILKAVHWVWDFIVANWPYLLGILMGPFGLAAAAIYKNFDTIKGWAQDAINFIVGVWNGLVGFFTGLPGRILGIFQSIWGGIEDAFKAVINGVIDVWNMLHFTLPKVDVLGVHIGGETIGVPTIPHLAQGGLITSTGLVYAHAGEAITPIDKVPRGPAVQIQNASFSSEADVDMLMRKAEFAVSAGRL